MARRITRTPGRLRLTRRFELRVYHKRISRRYKKWLKLSEFGIECYKTFLWQNERHKLGWGYDRNTPHLENGKIPIKQHPNRPDTFIKYAVE